MWDSPVATGTWCFISARARPPTSPCRPTRTSTAVPNQGRRRQTPARPAGRHHREGCRLLPPSAPRGCRHHLHSCRRADHRLRSSIADRACHPTPRSAPRPSPQRHKGSGAKVLNIYWTVGPYDLVAVVEAPDDETATAVLLQVGGLGNVRTTTLRAFGREEMDRIITKATG